MFPRFLYFMDNNNGEGSNRGMTWEFSTLVFYLCTNSRLSFQVLLYVYECYSTYLNIYENQIYYDLHPFLERLRREQSQI